MWRSRRSVACEGRVPRVARVAVEAVRRVDALSQEAVDVAAGAPGDRNAFAIRLEAGVEARGDRHRALRVRAPRSSLTLKTIFVPVGRPLPVATKSAIHARAPVAPARLSRFAPRAVDSREFLTL